MTSFFDLSESKKRGLSLSELHNYAERLEINIHKNSEKTGKNVRKTKQELIDEIDAVYIKNKIEKKENEKKSNKKNDKCNLKIALRLSNEEFDKVKENDIFNEEYLEETYNIKVEFGTILCFNKYYFYNKDNIFVELKFFNNTNYIIIPRNITKYIDNAVKYFTESSLDLNIYSIELNNKDKYLSEIIELDKNDKLNGINFNYTYIFNEKKYYMEIELNYLGPKNIYDKSFKTFKFFPKENINLIQLIDFHNKLSESQFSFIFKIYGPPNFNFKPKWTENHLIKNLNIDKGNKKKDDDSSYECELYTTMYSRYKNIENIKNQYHELLNNNETDICLMVSDKNFLKFVNNNEFNDTIKELGNDLIDFEKSI